MPCFGEMTECGCALAQMTIVVGSHCEIRLTVFHLAQVDDLVGSFLYKNYLGTIPLGSVAVSLSLADHALAEVSTPDMPKARRICERQRYNFS